MSTFAMDSRVDLRSLLALLPVPVRQACLRCLRTRRSRVLLLITVTGFFILLLVAWGSRQVRGEES